MEFYYDIKARQDTDGDSFQKWSWPPVWSGRIEAKDSKEARAILKAEYEEKFSRDGNYLLNIKPMSPYLLKRFELVKCSVCEQEYTPNDIYSVGLSNSGYCSSVCHEKANNERERQRMNLRIDEYSAFYQGFPVIYRVHNVKTDMSYIGKSIRSFTLRWWEHLCSAKSGSDSKFHAALQGSELTDWQFSIVETISFDDSVMDKNKYIFEREMFWINQFNSINKGYNTTVSLKIEVENKDQFKIDYHEEEQK